MRRAGRALLADVDAAIFTPILTVSEIAATLAMDKRLLFLSSNNVAIDPDAPVYAALREAEARIRSAAADATILRPTMIYGYPGDGNISTLLRAMRRLPVIPMVGAGRALQQPIFYRDLAVIAADLILSNAPTGDYVAVAGPASVTQAQLYREVRKAACSRCVIAPIPAMLAGPMARLATAIGLRAPLNQAQIVRADRDKTPVGGTVILGETTLADGLRDLAGALDGAARGA